MGRYNFNVVKGQIGSLYHIDKPDMGIIATSCFWTYALSVIFNGPLADRIGGRKAILIGALGAAVFNLAIGLLFFGGWNVNIVLGMSLLYSLNGYFQSFGALSVVKVNAAWFHVRERGFFGGVFGIMISSGYALAFGVGNLIIAHLPWYWVFIIPSGAILFMAAVVYFMVRDRPSHAGFPDFDTADASSGDETPVNMKYLAGKVFGNPIIQKIAAAEFCTGFVRQGLLLYYVEYLDEMFHIKRGTELATWAGAGVTIGGIVGGLICGWMSDKLFQSRRAPVACFFYLVQIPSLLFLQYAGSPVIASFMVGFCCTWIFGVHGMLSAAAAMDFGGKKAAATATGMLDGIQYVASGFTGYGLGWIIKHFGWGAWTWSIIPFSIIGAVIMTRLWNVKPARAAH